MTVNGPRVPLLSSDDARSRAAEAGIPDALAELNIFRALLHNPPVAKRMSDFLLYLLGRGGLPVRLRELIIMRIGWITNSEYEWAQHWRIALGLGVPESDLLAVRNWPGTDRFGPADRAVLSAVDEVVAAGSMSQETWAACVEHVSGEPAALVELVSVIGLWTMVSGVLRTLDIPLESGTEPWPPDGMGP